THKVRLTSAGVGSNLYLIFLPKFFQPRSRPEVERLLPQVSLRPEQRLCHYRTTKPPWVSDQPCPKPSYPGPKLESILIMPTLAKKSTQYSVARKPVPVAV